MPLTDETSKITYVGNKGSTNNTTAVTMVSDPGTGAAPRVIDMDGLGVLNRDTVTATVIIRQTGGSGTIVVDQVTIATGDKWTNAQRYVVSPGETLTIELAGNVTTNQLTWTVSEYYTND